VIELRFRSSVILFVLFASALIILNGLTLLSALRSTSGTQELCEPSGCIMVARDFSAYYEGAYRFINNPSQVYHQGSVSGDYTIFPNPQYFRYSPFFLPLFIVPFVILFNYHNALIAFDSFQFALLPIIAYILFLIMKNAYGKNMFLRKETFALFSVTLWFALLQPLVPSVSNLTFWSWSYWRLWVEGEARVLQTLLIVLTFYLILRDSKYSGLTFVLGSFDPRMSLISLPLIFYLCRKRRNLRKFALSTLVSFVGIYVPTLLYANLGTQFFSTILINDFAIYSYEWIPILTIISLAITIIYSDWIQRTRASSEDGLSLAPSA
jgi:hypothetical protein